MKARMRQKRCDASGRAYAGSQRQLQFYVNEKPGLLELAIEGALGQELRLYWVSPLKTLQYKEYKDVEFLHALSLSKYEGELRKFWPNGGPRWDALACVGAAPEACCSLRRRVISQRCTREHVKLLRRSL